MGNAIKLELVRLYPFLASPETFPIIAYFPLDGRMPREPFDWRLVSRSAFPVYLLKYIDRAALTASLGSIVTVSPVFGTCTRSFRT